MVGPAPGLTIGGCFVADLTAHHFDAHLIHDVFRWNDWNIDHIAEHGVTPEEAEYVVNHAHRPYPQRRGGGRYLVVAQLLDGTYAQVAFIFSPPGVVL